MTGWIIAHRFWHVFEEGARNGAGAHPSSNLRHRWPTINKANQKTYQAINDLMYAISGVYSSGARIPFKSMGHLFLTTKAGRDDNLTDIGEVKAEAFAQYILTGKITFKPLPDSVVINGNTHDAIPERKERADTAIEAMRQMFTTTFEQLIRYSRGKMFIL